MADSVAALQALGAATLGESGGRAMHARIKPVWPSGVLAGPASTVRCAPTDNLAIHVAVASGRGGAVLVVETEGDDRGYWGEVLTTAAQARGLAGLVIDGGVRDVAALEGHGFPVFARVVSLPGATKTAGGEVGGEVTVGDVVVADGDWIVADVDGVVVIAKAELDAALARGQARAEGEQAYFAALRGGATTVDLLGLDADRVTRR